MHVRVRVPATSANLGPGFDCLGLALKLYNTVDITDGSAAPSSYPFLTEIHEAYAKRLGKKLRSHTIRITGDVPPSRGLGSSVTIRLGVLHGLNQLHGAPLTRHQIYELAARLEGHPDNAAPAEFGGFTICRPDGSFQRFTVSPRLHFVLLIPKVELPTTKARAVLPAKIPHLDGVRSAASAAAIAAAFASRNYAALRGAFEDGLHEPYRRKLLPILEPVVAAARHAGAYGGWLSGAGSAIACVTESNPEPVADAMHKAADAIPSITKILHADNQGVKIRTTS